jgi:hypothetical protein
MPVYNLSTFPYLYLAHHLPPYHNSPIHPLCSTPQVRPGPAQADEVMRLMEAANFVYVPNPALPDDDADRVFQVCICE